jgi:hypothetical protein
MNRIDRVLDLLDQAEKMMDKGGARVRVLEAIRLLEENPLPPRQGRRSLRSPA